MGKELLMKVSNKDKGHNIREQVGEEFLNLCSYLAIFKWSRQFDKSSYGNFEWPWYVLAKYIDIIKLFWFASSVWAPFSYLFYLPITSAFCIYRI